MKAIVSLADPVTPNSYAEAGMNERCIVEGATVSACLLLAKSYALGRPCRVEIFGSMPGGLFAAPINTCVIDSRGLITAWKG